GWGAAQAVPRGGSRGRRVAPRFQPLVRDGRTVVPVPGEAISCTNSCRKSGHNIVEGTLFSVPFSWSHLPVLLRAKGRLMSGSLQHSTFFTSSRSLCNTTEALCNQSIPGEEFELGKGIVGLLRERWHQLQRETATQLAQVFPETPGRTLFRRHSVMK